MHTEPKTLSDFGQQADLLDQLPVGITLIDLEGRILYYNAFCARIVDRKPAYIGRDIRSCHKDPASIDRIDRMLEDIRTGMRREATYDTLRNGQTLAVTVSPYRENGKLAGFLQSFVVKSA